MTGFTLEDKKNFKGVASNTKFAVEALDPSAQYVFI